MSRDPDGNGALNIEVVRATISRLARAASIEINVAELKEVKRSSAYLPAGTKVHITHVPKQTFEETQSACQVLREAGFEPVPHIPVRAIGGEEIIDRFLGSIVTSACVREVLLIAGDY